jgi:asparagine synthase (glutamine-hydrolysing)
VSGIVGVYRRDESPLGDTVISDMLGAIRYRGPDGVDTWTEGAVGLGNLMLRSTPESLSEKLPKPSGCGRFVIAADARIDNRDELITRLDINDRPAREIDDSDLIVQAYQKWGPTSPEKLVGDFAYCIWDRVERQIFCCRDAFGVRPFYYYLSDAIFAFGSEIRSLLKVPEVPRRLNEVMVADYLTGLRDDKTTTFYKDIVRLAPGSWIAVSTEDVRSGEYWRLDPSYELHLGSEDEYVETFRSVFEEAVRCRLRSSVPVATTLSGGLDSSSVTCTAREILKREGKGPLLTLSMVYDLVPECDEREFIDTVVAQGGIEPFYFTADNAVPLPYFGLDDIPDHDDPFDAPHSFAVQGMGMLREKNIRVVLDGLDGDNAVSHGYGYLAELAWTGKVLDLIREARSIAARQERPFLDLLWCKAIRPLTPAYVRRTWRRLGGYGNRPWPKTSLISSEFAKRLGFEDRYRELQAFYLKPLTDAREDHYHRLFWGGITHQIESTNKVFSRYSVEPRHPFFDRRLLELCVALPHRLKIADGWTRLVLRKAMEGLLPERIERRPGKTDFRPSVDHAILQSDRLVFDRMMEMSSRAVKYYVDVEAMGKSYHDFLHNPLRNDPTCLWFAISLGLWLDKSGLGS